MDTVCKHKQHQSRFAIARCIDTLIAVFTNCLHISQELFLCFSVFKKAKETNINFSEFCGNYFVAVLIPNPSFYLQRSYCGSDGKSRIYVSSKQLVRNAFHIVITQFFTKKMLFGVDNK